MVDHNRPASVSWTRSGGPDWCWHPLWIDVERHDEGSAVAPGECDSGGHVNSLLLGTNTIHEYGLLSCMLITDPVPPQGNAPFSMDMKYSFRVKRKKVFASDI